MTARVWLVAGAVALVIAGVILFIQVRRRDEPVIVVAALHDAAPRVVPPPPPIPVDAPQVVARADAASSAPAARDERETVLGDLRNSGTGHEPWDVQAITVFDSISRGQVTTSEVGCFIAGCGATFVFPSLAEYRRDFDALQTADAYRAWTGGKRWTTPEVGSDGRVSVALVLYRPD